MDRYYLAHIATRNLETNEIERRRFGLRLEAWESLSEDDRSLYEQKSKESIDRTISEKYPSEEFDVKYDIIAIDGNWTHV